jgi:hypothetical protein
VDKFDSAAWSDVAGVLRDIETDLSQMQPHSDDVNPEHVSQTQVQHRQSTKLQNVYSRKGRSSRRQSKLVCLCVP